MSTDIYTQTSKELAPYYDQRESKALARIVIEDVLHLSLTKIMAGIEKPLTQEQQTRLHNVVRRLKNHEPIQYIIGQTDFCDIPIRVNSSVLIPRPETEQIVTIVTSLFDDTQDISLMDACTGSGCIAIAIKVQRPQWHIEACDISPQALQTARFNAELNNADIGFSNIDILSDTLPDRHFDIITSNPPYVMNKEKAFMQQNVLQHEPHLALFVDDSDPLVFYRALATLGTRSLHKDGILICEINHLLSGETENLFKAQGYADVTIINDSFNKPRFVLCRK